MFSIRSRIMLEDGNVSVGGVIEYYQLSVGFSRISSKRSSESSNNSLAFVIQMQ